MSKPETTERILAAIERVAASGREPSKASVRARLVRDSPAERGASFSQIVPLLRQWKADRVRRAGGRIEAAVQAIIGLRTKLERDEVRRLVQARTEGEIRCQFVAKGRPRKRLLAHSAEAREIVAGLPSMDRPPTDSVP